MDNLHPLIRMHVDSLLRCHASSFEVDDVRKGSEAAEFADRFCVLVPCCAARLRWHIIYNMNYIKVPPDVIFGQHDESFQPLVSKGSSPHLVAMENTLREWDVYDSQSLLKLMISLRELYLLHQRSLVERLTDPRVTFELSTMAGLQGIDMFLLGGPEKPEEVQLSIPLGDIDLSPLSSLIRGGAQDITRDSVLNRAQFQLQVAFPLARRMETGVQLAAAPAVMQALAMVDVELRLPPWIDGTCVMEYVPIVQTQMQRQVAEAGLSAELRRSLLVALPAVFGRPLEMETGQFRRVTFFLACNNFPFLVHIAMPGLFPKQQPILTLQSSQCFDANGRPVTSRGYDDYPWSPRWNPEEMGSRICSFIQDEAVNFKRFCTERR